MIKKIEVVNEQVLVMLAGSMYVEDAAAIRENVFNHIENGKTTIVIDLSEVDYIDSSGLGMLVAIQKRAVPKGGSIVLKGPTGLVKDMLELTRLSKVFEIV